MKNISIFAHYDRDNIIDDYVIYYLNELKKVSEKVIFVSDCDLSKNEVAKLNGVADFWFAHKHGEYDFGSYKRGWEIALKNGLLEEAETLTFANDSCYGPFHPLASIYEEMSARDCDFWGMTSNKNCLEGKYYPCAASGDRHMQSYFMVFKKQVFKNKIFENFIESIKKESDKFNVIEKYEIGLSSLLCEKGFKYACVYASGIAEYNLADVLCRFECEPFIFMKRTLLKAVYFVPFLHSFLHKIESCYDVDILIKNLKRTRRFRDFDIRYARKQLIRVHLQERRIFLLGRWVQIDEL